MLVPPYFDLGSMFWGARAPCLLGWLLPWMRMSFRSTCEFRIFASYDNTRSLLQTFAEMNRERLCTSQGPGGIDLGDSRLSKLLGEVDEVGSTHRARIGIISASWSTSGHGAARNTLRGMQRVCEDQITLMPCGILILILNWTGP